MRILIIVEPNTAPPPEQMPLLLEATQSWRDRWRSKMESFEFFAGRGGGWGVIDVEDESELSQAVMEFPMGPFSNMQAHPTVDGDEALKRLTATTQELLTSMASTG